MSCIVKVRRRALLGIGVVVCALGFSQPAWATELELPAGSVAKVTNVKFSACNKLAYGYQLDAGTKNELAGFAGGCLEMSEPDATIGPFGVTHTLRFYLTDNSCGFTFYSDGSEGSTEHAKVTGTNPYAVQLWDGGASCQYPPGKSDPEVPPGNLTATVTIEHALAPPEFGRCTKVVGKAGKYSNGGCTKNVVGSKTEKEFEWTSGPGAKNKYTGSGAASTLFETTEGYSAGCASEKASGEYVKGSDNKHLTMTLEYSGCKVINSPGGAINGAPCQTGGKASGEAADNPLVGEVGWLDKAKKLTALLLEPAPGYAPNFTPIVECAGYGFQVRTHGRGLLVPIKNDAMKKEEALKFKQTKGIQEPDAWHVGEPGQETTYLELFGPVSGQSGIGFELKLKNEEKLELNIVV
jgi:hypothetical protein